MYSHFGDGRHNAEIARLNLALLLTLKGTPVLYNGEEIGMSDYLIMDVNRFRDPLGNRAFQLETELLQSAPEEALVYAALNGRDKCRTPFQWENAPQAGFCPPEVEPWLPVNPDYTQGVNLADQRGDPGSLFAYYRRLLGVRRENPALVRGGYEALETENADCLVFRRVGPEQICVVALNYGEQEQPVRLPHSARVIFSSVGEGRAQAALAPFEARILEA
jgi:alpha-glucosidase